MLVALNLVNPNCELNAMSKKLYRMVIICLSLVLMLVLHQWYVALAAPQVPYMDTMTYLVQLDKILKGEISWLDAYGSSEHRGLIYPLVTFIEWAFWGLDARISTALTGIVVAATFFYWLRVFLSARENTAKDNTAYTVSAVIVCFAAAVIVASPASFELWTLDLGFAQLLKNFLIVSFLYFLAISRIWSKNVINAIFVGVYGGLLILFATYGWSYPFLIACLFVLIASVISSPGIKNHALIVIIVMLLAQGLYVYSGHGVLLANQSAAANGISLFGLISGVIYGAGTVFIGSEVIQKISLPVIIPMIFGALLLVAALVALAIAFFERTKGKIFFSGLLIFSLTVLAGVAVARGFPVFTNTGASRYFVDYIWLLLAPVAIVFTAQESILIRNIPSRLLSVLSLKKLIMLAKFFVMGLFLVAILGHLTTWYVELKTAPYRAVIFKSMAEVYHNGVANESDAALLQMPFETAKQGVIVAQTYNLSVLRQESHQCTLKTAGFTGDWYSADDNDVRWLKQRGTITLKKCLIDVTIKGFIPENFNSRNLRITYGEVDRIIAVAPGKEFSFVVNMRDRKKATIEFHLDATTIPASVGINADTRELGLLLTYIGE
jgi:hypothetical protein